MMERIDVATENLYDENVERLAALFPEVVTEVREADGSLRHTIDVEALKARVGDVAEGQRERYQLHGRGRPGPRRKRFVPLTRPCVHVPRRASTGIPPKTSISRATTSMRSNCCVPPMPARSK